MTKEEQLLKYQMEQHQRNREIDRATQHLSIQEKAGFIEGVDWAYRNPRKYINGEMILQQNR
jgi:hypothetical protein